MTLDWCVGGFTSLDGREWTVHEIRRGELIIVPAGQSVFSHGCRRIRGVDVSEDYRGAWITYGHEFLRISQWVHDRFVWTFYADRR